MPFRRLYGLKADIGAALADGRGDAADVEVFLRACGLDAVVRVGGDFLVAQQVVLVGCAMNGTVWRIGAKASVS